MGEEQEEGDKEEKDMDEKKDVQMESVQDIPVDQTSAATENVSDQNEINHGNDDGKEHVEKITEQKINGTGEQTVTDIQSNDEIGDNNTVNSEQDLIEENSNKTGDLTRNEAFKQDGDNNASVSKNKMDDPENNR